MKSSLLAIAVAAAVGVASAQSDDTGPRIVTNNGKPSLRARRVISWDSSIRKPLFQDYLRGVGEGSRLCNTCSPALPSPWPSPGDIILHTGLDGRIGYRQGNNSQPVYFNDQSLNFQAQLGEAAVAREAIRGSIDTVRTGVNVQLEAVNATMAAQIAAANAATNASLNEVSGSMAAQIASLNEVAGSMAAQIAAANAAANASLNEVSGALRAVGAVVSRMAACANDASILGANDQCVNPMPTCGRLNFDPGNGGFLRGDAVEAIAGAQETVVCPRAGTGPDPGVIQCLRNGNWSNTSAICQNCSDIGTGSSSTTCSECFNGRCMRTSVPGLDASAPAQDCNEIKQVMGGDATDGLYWVGRGRGAIWQTYCAHSVQGGGWSLVASIHENDVTSSDPNRADRWTSAGNGIGSRAWQDTSTFGSITSAATGDYKNPGYGRTIGSNIMFWHVANGSPANSYKANARYRYFTRNNMLTQQTGRTFAGIFSGGRAIQTSTRSCSGRLRTPISWDTTGTRGEFYDSQISPNFRNSHMGRDQMDFSSGTDGHCPTCIFAMCPGVSCSSGCANHEHACVGGAMPLASFCSDFTGQGWSGVPCPGCAGTGWSAGGRYLRSAIFMFVK